MAEVLRVHVRLTGCEELTSGTRAVRLLPFDGTAEGSGFKGVILPGGVDTQIDFAPGQGTLSARYMLDGTDAEGKACRVFIDNGAVTRAGRETVTRPRILTDSASLKWLESAALTGRIEAAEGRLDIVISSEDTPERRFLTIRRAGLTLRALLEKKTDGPCPLVLLLHGFGGHMDARGGLFQELSDRLTAAGLATLRLDFNGHGQSEGDFTDMTPYNEIEDAAALLRYARTLEGVTGISVVGHSQGGVIAGMLAGYYHDVIQRLVLLAPAASLKTDAQEGHCMGVAYDPQRIPDSVDVGMGHVVGGLYFRLAQTLPIYEVTGQFAGPALVIIGKKDAVVSRRAARRYMTRAAQGEFELYDSLDHGLQGADHAAMLDRVVAFLR